MLINPKSRVALFVALAMCLHGCSIKPSLETFCNTSRSEIEGTYRVQLNCQAVDAACYQSCVESDENNTQCSSRQECLGETQNSEATIGLATASHIESLSNSDITHWLWVEAFVAEGTEFVDYPSAGAKCDTDSGGDATPNVLTFNLPAAQGTTCSIRIHALNSDEAIELGETVQCAESRPDGEAAPQRHCEATITKTVETLPEKVGSATIDESWQAMGRDSFFELGLTINAIWALDENNAFAVGELGTVLHYDGEKWSLMSTGVLTNLQAVWGTSESNVYAGGSMGRILHFNGEEWTKVTGADPTESSSFENRSIRALWGFNENEIYAGGTHMHYFNGETWDEIQGGFNGTLTGIWGSEPNNIYTVSEAGVWHYDGTQWAAIDVPVHSPAAISGTSAENIFISGWWGGLAHFDGSQWSTLETVTSQSLTKIWAAGDGEAFAIGRWPGESAQSRIVHYALDKASVETAPLSLRAIHGAEGAIFTAGENLTILKKER